MARAEQVLGLLEKSPGSPVGITAMVRAVGLRRAVALARKRVRKRKTWQARLVLGRVLLRARRRGAALAAFRRALGKAAKSGEPALGWVAQALVEAGARRAARGMIKRWSKRFAADATAAQIDVRLALAARDLQRAVAAQRRLAGLRPKVAQIQSVLARLQVRRGELDAAATTLGKMLKLGSLSAPARCAALRDLAGLQNKLERFGAAVKSYRAALKLAQRGSWIDRDLRRRLLMGYKRRGDTKGMLAEARLMLKSDPKAGLALKVLGDAALRARRTTAGVAYLERYLKVSPGDHATRARLMFLLTRLRRVADATRHAGELHKRRPSVPRHLLEYAALLGDSGKRAAARAALRKGIALYAKDGDGLQLVAGALATLGDRAGAQMAFTALVKLARSDPRHQRSIGRYLWRKGKRVEALDAWGALISKPTAVGYYTWVELVLSVDAHRQAKLRARLTRQMRAGLRRFPTHSGLRTLRAQLLAASSR